MKNRILFFVFFLFGMLLMGHANAQEPIRRSTEIIKISGKEYYLHHVKAGETLYSLARVYNVTIEELEVFNPDVKEGLKTGHVLGIPVRPEAVSQEEPQTVTVEKPVAETVEEPVVEAIEEPVVEAIEEPIVEAVDEPVVEAVEEPLVEVVEEPVVEVVEEPVVEAIEEPVVEAIEEPIVEAVEEPVVETVEEPVVEAIDEPVVEAVEEPVVEVVEEPVVEAVEEPVVEAIEEPVVEAVEEPVVEVVEEPVVEAVEEPVVETIEEPVAASVEEPAAGSVVRPIVKLKKEVNPDHVIVVGEITYRIVQADENLYDIAKECGIDVVELKKNNPGLTNEPAAGTRVAIPNIINENDYIVHSCEKNERVSSLLKRWKVDEAEFREKNISVGTHVFENQIVLIPITPVTNFYWVNDVTEEIVEVEEEEEIEAEEPEIEPQVLFLDEDLDAMEQCYADPENANKRYKVALMVPLYLGEMGKLDVAKENVPKAQKSRSMAFLQFYEGFIMAVKDLEKEGLKLDLNVFDVTENVASAERALTAIEGKDYDLIVGPFYGKSFTVIEDYAKTAGITMINPLSNRESVIVDSPNVVKVKPGNVGLIMSITNLVKNYYSDANVFIVSREKSTDSIFLNQLEHHLNHVINEEVVITSNELLQFARHESELRELGSRLVPTLEVEGQVYSTSDLQSGHTNQVVLENTVKRYPFSELASVKSQLSGVRDNVIIAYGDNNVFATQMLNSLAKTADRYPITLVCIPDWSKYEKLLVDNLLKMNAIYISDCFVDYGSDEVKRFVLTFRERYSAEPQKYAFQGYDLAYYFMTALMRYGSDDLLRCLHCHRPSLMHTRYRFYYRNYLSPSQNDGKENMYWSVYQYDKDEIELKPINPFEKQIEETK